MFAMVSVCTPCSNPHDFRLDWFDKEDRHMSERLGLGGLCTLMEMHQQPGNSMGLLYVSEKRCFYGIHVNKEMCL